MTRPIIKILIVLSLIIAITGIIVYNNRETEYQLTEQDKNEIISMTNMYYESIINRNFYEALELCNLEDSNIDLKTRVVALTEVMDNVVEVFELENKATRVDKYKNGDDTGYMVKVSLNLKYKNTLGGFAGEFVYVEKINDQWKIQMIHGLDRYGFYRSGEYKYDRLIDFLDPK